MPKIRTLSVVTKVSFYFNDNDDITDSLKESAQVQIEQSMRNGFESGSLKEGGWWQVAGI